MNAPPPTDPTLAPWPMLGRLLSARRFAALFWCQFFSVFNDNFVRNMLAMLILFRLGETDAGPLITLAVGVFMLPSLLLSGAGGYQLSSNCQRFGGGIGVLKTAGVSNDSRQKSGGHIFVKQGFFSGQRLDQRNQNLRSGGGG